MLRQGRLVLTKVALFSIDITCKFLAITQNPEDARLALPVVASGIVIGTCEVMPMILLLGILIATGREVEAEPSLDLKRLSNILKTV